MQQIAKHHCKYIFKLIYFSHPVEEDIEIPIEINQSNVDVKVSNEKSAVNKKSNIAKLAFKKHGWTSKIRAKEKNIRTTKRAKTMLTDNLDALSYNLCNYYL
jgi:hypothetical protein